MPVTCFWATEGKDAAHKCYKYQMMLPSNGQYHLLIQNPTNQRPSNCSHPAPPNSRSEQPCSRPTPFSLAQNHPSRSNLPIIYHSLTSVIFLQIINRPKKLMEKKWPRSDSWAAVWHLRVIYLHTNSSLRSRLLIIQEHFLRRTIKE